MNAPKATGSWAPEAVAAEHSGIRAIDYKTGTDEMVPRHRRRRAGPLSTAGHLLFGGDGARNFIAFDRRTANRSGTPRCWPTTNGPQTWMVDGKQFVLVAGGDTLYAFTLSD